MYEHRNTPRRAAVITPRHVFYGDGMAHDVPASLRHDLGAILAGTIGRFATHSTIVVTDTRTSDHRAHSDDVRAAGWAHSDVGAWTLYHRADGQTVAVGLLAELEPRHVGVLFDQDQDPSNIALLLDRYHRLTGIGWRGTPATTALAMIRDQYHGAAPRWQLPKTGPGYATGPLIWSRELTEREREWGWVHTFDASSAYLGSAAGAELAWSVLDHTGPRTFDKHTPGYWWCELGTDLIRDNIDQSRPPIITYGRIKERRAWLTTPMVQLLVDLGYEFDVVDAWTAASHNGRRGAARVLRTWGEKIRDARAELERAPGSQLAGRLNVAVKRTYKDATGGMQREGMRVYRPDWAHTLIDLWRATLLRRIVHVHQTQGCWPVAVKTDSVSYADCIEHPSPRWATRHYGDWAETLTDALRVGSCTVDGCGCVSGSAAKLGTYKHAETHTAEAWTIEHTPRRALVGAR